MTPLAEILRTRIRTSGPLPFPSWMAAALYHPEHGYYARGPQRVGRGGDFYTSVSVGAVFGDLWAGQFCEVWEHMARPGRFTVVESGANDGVFARDVLTWAQRERPDFAEALRYRIDEPLPRLAEAQARTLEPFSAQVEWNLPEAVEGVFFANELLDAVPFRRVRRTGDGWCELSAGLDGDAFTWVETELRDYAVRRRLAALEAAGFEFPAGYETEVAPAMISAVRTAAAFIARGVIAFADYGYREAEYYHPARRTGTLRCYREHRAHEDPFDAPGETDITAHVDFTWAIAGATAAVCVPLGLCEQGRFLTGAAEHTLRRMEGRTDAGKWLRQFQTLTHPEHMGRRFHVLAFHRGLSEAPALSGFRYSAGMG
jgi:SAM-dependent MidA family methyltransferase